MNIKGKEILNFSVSAEIEGKTSYFDLDKRELPDDVKCTLYSLCKEISAGSTQTKGGMIEDLIKKFHNNDGSGIIDHLKKDLRFDVDDYDGFQKLQFLKLLYRYEKDKSEGNNVFRITKVLRKPRIENIKSPYYEVSTLYGENFKNLLADLEGVIGEKEAQTRRRILGVRNQRWNNVLSTMIELSFEEEALKKENFEIAKQELIIIRDFLKEKIYKQLEEPKKHKPVDNIFMAFYTYLIEHMLLCEEEDRVMSYNIMERYESAEEEYINTFVEWDKYIISKKQQEQILERLIEDGTCLFDISGDKTHIVDMNYMIFRKNEKPNKEEIAALRFAKKYLGNLRKWICIQKPLEIAKDSLLASWFIAIVQEMAYCKIKHVTVKNDAYGVEEKKKTLTSTLKNANRAEAKHIQEWMIRIENRYAADIGGTDLQIIVREIEYIFEGIRRWALQHHDLSDFIFVDDALIHTVERMVVPRFVAKNNLDRLAGRLLDTGIIQRVFYDSTVGLFNLGREIELDKTMIERFVGAVMKNKKEFDKAELIYKEYKDNIVVHYNIYDEYINYFYMYSFEKNGRMRITYFRPQVSDEVIEQYDSYGLGRFAIT